MEQDKVLNFCLMQSQYMDDSVKGEVEVPSIGLFDFLINKDMRLLNNMS